MSITVDGNHHANRYTKNTDRNDRSLLVTLSGYFPGNEYRLYLDQIPVTKEVSPLPSSYSTGPF